MPANLLNLEINTRVSFSFECINRLEMPVKHVIVCEDDITHQALIADHLAKLFGRQGKVQISFVPGGLMAFPIIQSMHVDLIILDHDMPHGNGSELLAALFERKKDIPIVTFSDEQENNKNLQEIYPSAYLFNKTDVLNGLADEIIMRLLRF